MPATPRSVAPQTDQHQIQHFTHQHILQKLFNYTEFLCNGCNTSGYGTRYRCSYCDFDLHELCATCPHLISSHLHPQHHLMLVNRPAYSCTCDVCREYANGLSYTCRACNFDVHPLCTMSSTLNLTKKRGEKDNQADVINRRPSHKRKRWFKKCWNVGKYAANLFFTCVIGSTVTTVTVN